MTRWPSRATGARTSHGDFYATPSRLRPQRSPWQTGNHSFHAPGITAYLANGGALEHAQEMAAHESPQTTKLYDRTKERLTQDEVERIRL